MISVVITNHNRSELLDQTLKSLTHSKEKNFNVIIVDSDSDKDIILPELPYDVRIIKQRNELWSDKYVCNLNIGFLYAFEYNPDIIIMQHSECYHEGDILSYAKKVTDETYISFGCYALGEEETPESFQMINRPCTPDGQRSWYNHPVIRPVGYNFCSAISAKNLIKLNGFDERFMYGCAFEDNYFLHQIAMLGLRVEITDDPFVLHQYHLVGWNPERWPINQQVYETLRQGKEFRAKHILTPNL